MNADDLRKDPVVVGRAKGWNDRRIKRARHSVADFFEYVMREQTTRKAIKIAPHQKVFLDFVMAHDRSVNMLPIATSKTFMTVAITLYLLGHNTTLRGAVVSATQAQAKKVLSTVSDYITQSPQLRAVFPLLRKSPRRDDPWTQTEITVDRPPGIPDASLYAYGMDGAITGARLSWIVVDDILTRENTATKEQRDKVYQWLDSSVLSRLDPRNARIVVTNTAWHPEDIVHRLEENGWPTLRMDITGGVKIQDDLDDLARAEADGLPPPYWTHPELRPATRDPLEEFYRLRSHDPDPDNEVPLWPERFLYIGDEKRPPAKDMREACLHARDYIASERRRHLPAQFNQLFMNLCRDDATAMCKAEWVELCKQNARDRKFLTLVSKYDGANPTFTGVDLAFRKGEHADFTAFFTFEALPSGHRRILDVEFGQWDGPTIVEKLIAKEKAYKSILRVENNSAQEVLLQFARQKNASLPLKAHTTGLNKANPTYGVQAVFLDMMNGAWLIPNDPQGRCHPAVQKWIDECLYYTPAAHTGDVLMACLAPGALVTTARGLVPIEHVVEGDLVLTHKSRWRRVTGTTVHDHDGEAVRMKASGLMPMVATLNHPVWSATAWYKRDGSNRLIPEEWKFRLAEELRAGRKHAGMFAFSPVPTGWSSTTPTRFDLSRFLVRTPKPKSGKWTVSRSLLDWRGEKTYPRWLEVDEKFGMLIGLYLAEGSVGGKPGTGRHIISFALHEREGHLARFAEEQLNACFNAQGRFRHLKSEHGASFSASSVLAARFFTQLGKFSEKGMPWDWMSWPLCIRMAAVRGWLMGDGCLTGVNGRLPKLSGVSISRRLLEQMRLTLLEAGYLPSMSVFMHAGPRMFAGRASRSRDSWKLSLSESDTARFLNSGSPLEAEHWEWSPRPTRERTNARMLRIEGGAAIRFASTERFHYRGPVHNLHVEEDESYVAEGIAVHNSWFSREQAREFGALNPQDPQNTAGGSIASTVMSR